MYIYKRSIGHLINNVSLLFMKSVKNVKYETDYERTAGFSNQTLMPLLCKIGGTEINPECCNLRCIRRMHPFYNPYSTKSHTHTSKGPRLSSLRSLYFGSKSKVTRRVQPLACWSIIKSIKKERKHL